MTELFLALNTIEQQASAVVEALKEKMNQFGYKDITYRLEKMELDEVSIEVVGFAFWNEAGESITPGFFKFPDCFEQPYDTVDRFADLVIHLTLNEIALRLNRNIHYYYTVNGLIYPQEELTDSLLEEAILLSHADVTNEFKTGLYGCSDGLWLMQDEALRRMTLFDVCAVDD